jgi:hypothetical protein
MDEHYSTHDRIAQAASGLALIVFGIYAAINARESAERARDKPSVRLIRKFSLIKTSLGWDVALYRLTSVLIGLMGLVLVIFAVIGNALN